MLKFRLRPDWRINQLPTCTLCLFKGGPHLCRPLSWDVMLFLTRDVGQGGVRFKAPQGAVPLHGSHPTAQDPGREVHQLLSL